MNISDEKLSAFIDGELSETEMTSIRDALSQDENLSDRLSELLANDQRITEHYSNIDNRPMPKAVMEMLDEEKKSAQIIEFPLWKRAFTAGQNQLREHAAVAAVVALAIGFSVAQIAPIGKQQDNNWLAVTQGLDKTNSGSVITLANGQDLKPRLSFLNQSGEYCRQFQISDNEGHSENIACKSNNENSSWQLAASIRINSITDSNVYQTASGGSLLDSVLDQMISGEVLDAEEENKVINENWTH